MQDRRPRRQFPLPPGSAAGSQPCRLAILRLVASAFQFISVQEPRLTARLTRASARLDAVVVLDLEDSLWDVIDESRTPGLKRAGRAHLRTMAEQHTDLWSDQRIGVRVNRLASADRDEDLHCLADVSERVEFDCIVPTKVESAADLERWIDLLRDNNVAYRALIPIVETVRGITSLSEIATAARRLGVEWIVYGYYDHMLDARTWPFHDHADEAFWRLVEPIIEAIEGAGVRYVHPPYFRLNDLAAFQDLLGRLAATCRTEFGVISLGTRQTMAAAGHDGRGEPRATKAVHGLPDDTTPRDRARRVVDAFAVKRRTSLSFAIEPRTGEFISPHLYLAARRFLDDG